MAEVDVMLKCFEDVVEEFEILTSISEGRFLLGLPVIAFAKLSLLSKYIVHVRYSSHFYFGKFLLI